MVETSLPTIAPVNCAAGQKSARYGHSFSDVARKVVSIINLASSPPSRTWSATRSIRCASVAMFMSKGSPPSSELDLVGKELKISRDAGSGRQAHRPLRRDQRRSGHRHPRPRSTQSAAAHSRSR